MEQHKALLKVTGLSIPHPKQADFFLLKDIDFQINYNEILAIVGESGSGKSLTAMSILGLLPNQLKNKTEGSILFQEEELIGLSDKMYREIRSKKISAIFQEPMSALNPSMRCGKQLQEVITTHYSLSSRELDKRKEELLVQVRLKDHKRILRSYPHELSGGQKQRLMIAMALACNPELLIADEPTTALDVTVQKEILLLLKELQQDSKMSILFISHDLNLVSKFADKILVFKSGNCIESGITKDIFNNPKDIYTQALLTSRPSLEFRYEKLPTIESISSNASEFKKITPQQRIKKHQKIYVNKPILEVSKICKSYSKKKNWYNYTRIPILEDISFVLYKGETLGLVGESGCGKSTLSNIIASLVKADSGNIYYNEQDITQYNKKQTREIYKEIQLIFQDPFAVLHPKLSVGDALIEPILVHKIKNTRNQAKKQVYNLLNKVGLSSKDYNKYPHEFSGGQRQRINIARALCTEPKILICDESVSALDISMQAQILNLLDDLKEELQLSYIFISHDLSVVKQMSDRIIVMQAGNIIECREADDLYKNPQFEYTRKLIESIP